MTISLEEIKEIVRYGAMAPSGDNCQPWKLRYEKDVLFLFIDEKRDTSLYNANNSASYTALGAFIENMRIAATSFGFSLEERLFPKADGGGLVAEVRFTKAPMSPDPLFPFIEKRRTNRFGYKSAPLPPDAKKALAASVAEFDVSLSIAEGQVKKAAARASCVNDKILFENESIHGFLFDHIRWSKMEAERARDGMEIYNLGLNAFQQKMFGLLKSWRFVRMLNIAGFSRAVKLQSYMLSAGSSAMGLLTARGPSPKDFVIGGMALERLWITAASLGLAFQPMTGVTFLINRIRLAGGEGLSESHKKELLDAEKELERVFQLKRGDTMVMLFRTGYPSKETAATVRREVSEYLELKP